MPRRKDPDRERAEREARKRDMEKDTKYLVRFVRKGAPAYGRQPSDYFPVVEVPRDPRANPAMLSLAFERFQSRETVADWRQIADGYDIDSCYYP